MGYPELGNWLLSNYTGDLANDSNEVIAAWCHESIQRDREAVSVAEIFSAITASDFKQTADRDWLGTIMQSIPVIPVSGSASLKTQFQNGLKDPGLTNFNNLCVETVERIAGSGAGFSEVEAADIQELRDRGII